MNTQTKQTKHTPLPWIVLQSYTGRQATPIGVAVKVLHKTVGLATTTIFAETHGWNHEANAAFIVRAANSHQELLEAATLAQCDCSPRERDSGHKSGCWFPALQAAIAKARGEE